MVSVSLDVTCTVVYLCPCPRLGNAPKNTCKMFACDSWLKLNKSSRPIQAMKRNKNSSHPD